MTTKLTEIRAEFEARLAALSDLDALEQVRIAFLGKKGSVTELLKDLKNVSGEEKRVLGQEINLLKRECEERIAATVQDLKAKELERMVNSAESYDITLPADLSTGSYHPITMVRKELVQIFASMGFIVEDYFEVTDDYHCFEALNIPKNHPARDMQDTFYLDNGQLLKTHTSAAQNAIMRKYGAPVQTLLKKASSLEIAMICPLHGPVWRENIAWYVDKYQKWSTYTPEEEGVLIAYASVYGHTENAAEILAMDLREMGVKKIAMYDVSVTHPSYIVSDAFRFGKLAFLSSTYNSGIFPAMETLLHDIKAHALKKRAVALAENGSWAPTSGKQMRELLSGLQNVNVLENTVSIRSALNTDTREQLRELARQLAEA